MSDDVTTRQRAGLLIDAGRAADAMAVLAPLAASEPDDAETLRLIARALIELRRFGEAKRAARRALALQPDDATAYRLIAVASIRSSEHESAGRAARRARTIAPADWRTHYLVVMADCGAKDITADTRTSLAEALRLAPQAVEPRFAAGLAAQTSEEWGKAAQWYREALRIDPNHADARNNLAAIRLKRGDHGRAARTFADLAGENPSSERARFNVTVAYRMAMRWVIIATLSACMLRILFAFSEEESPSEIAQVFSAAIAAGAVLVALVIGIRFVAQLGRHRRAILIELARDTWLLASVVAILIALVSLVVSFFVWPTTAATIAEVAALGAVVVFRVAVAQARRARNRLGR